MPTSIGSSERSSDGSMETYLQVHSSQYWKLWPQRISKADIFELYGTSCSRTAVLVIGCRPNIWL